jgi:cyclic-di-GMP-binding protein
MPSFDIVSEVDMHEMTNAIDQANREISTRFDFKGIDASYTLADGKVTLQAEASFQVKQMQDIFEQKLAKRGIDLKSLQYGEIEEAMQQAKQVATIVEGIETDKAKKIVKMIKDTKIKVQASIQGEQVRVTGKKRDDLQAIMGTLKESKMDIPLQYTNFRD